MIQTCLSAFVASLGFGVIFNIHGRKLFVAALCGGIGGLFYALSLLLGISEAISLMIGAMALSIASEIAARGLKAPVTAFLVCALIPLVPGGGMYRTMLAAIRGDAQNTLNMGLQTLSIAGGLALGILLVSTIMRVYYQEKRKFLEKK